MGMLYIYNMEVSEHERTPNHPNLDHFSIERLIVWGIHHFRNPSNRNI